MPVKTKQHKSTKKAISPREARSRVVYEARQIDADKITLKPKTYAGVVYGVIKAKKQATAAEVYNHVVAHHLIKTKMDLKFLVSWLLSDLKRRKLLLLRKAGKAPKVPKVRAAA